MRCAGWLTLKLAEVSRASRAARATVSVGVSSGESCEVASSDLVHNGEQSSIEVKRRHMGDLLRLAV